MLLLLFQEQYRAKAAQNILCAQTRQNLIVYFYIIINRNAKIGV